MTPKAKIIASDSIALVNTMLEEHLLEGWTIQGGVSMCVDRDGIMEYAVLVTKERRSIF